MKKNANYRIALTAVLCAQAVALSFFENLIPPLPFMPPGAKPGFSNLITMFAAGSLGFSQALIITAVKSGFAFITRGATAAAMSFSGGLLSTIAMYFLMKYAKKYIGIVGVSVISALCHNVMRPDALIFVFPMLSFKSAFSLSSFTFKCVLICVNEEMCSCEI